jgi:hypothetical protein
MKPFVRFVSVLVVLAAPVVSSGCNREPGPGDSCKPSEIRCVDPKTELACQKGVFMAAPCKGPLGCSEDGKHLFCDFSGNSDGDPCSLDDEGAARCAGDTERVTCLGGKYTRDFCRGPEGCKAIGTVKCDQSKAQDGDPCRVQTNACSADGKTVLSCVQGKFRPSAQCPGEGGCAVVEHEISCDLGKKEDPKKR